MVPIASTTILPWLARRLGCDVVFNLADVPILTALPQVFLFDWPYAAYPDSPAWKLSGRYEQFVRKSKLAAFRLLSSRVDVFLAQSEVLAARIRHLYGFNNVGVVPNAVSIDNMEQNANKDFELGDGFKLLCLSRYYSHKNIEVFIPVAERILASGENISIITTISGSDGPGAMKFLDQVAKRGLRDIIKNVGSVPMRDVPSIYRQTDALLLPTLLESFSGTYVEAMYHRRPILTSRLPFAEAVCGHGAFYFDPHDPNEIYTQILRARDDADARGAVVREASMQLEEMPNWADTYIEYSAALDAAILGRK
jgi:glycosyltransferase involved in cell wall biosynthesis